MPLFGAADFFNAVLLETVVVVVVVAASGCLEPVSGVIACKAGSRAFIAAMQGWSAVIVDAIFCRSSMARLMASLGAGRAVFNPMAWSMDALVSVFWARVSDATLILLLAITTD